MNNQFPPRIPIGTLKEFSSKYGGFVLLGRVGMADVVIQKTKKGDKWMMYFQEQRQKENRGFATQGHDPRQINAVQQMEQRVQQNRQYQPDPRPDPRLDHRPQTQPNNYNPHGVDPTPPGHWDNQDPGPQNYDDLPF